MSEPIDRDRRRFIGGVAMTIFAAKLGIFGSAKAHSPVVSSLPVEGKMPALDSRYGWLNSQPLRVEDLRGKVVLVDFWTYTCINWRRQLPYIRAWAEKYMGHGLITIGVHTPEFSFERNPENVRRAVKETRVGYPVVIDSDYAVWRAFENEYWPALYFADAQGRIRHHVFGEDEYEKIAANHPGIACRGRIARRSRGSGIYSCRRPRSCGGLVESWLE